ALAAGGRGGPAAASPLVRGAAVWALSRLVAKADLAALADARRPREADPGVADEWTAALGRRALESSAFAAAGLDPRQRRCKLPDRRPDPPAAHADEIVDLKIDDRALVVGRQAEIATVPEDRLVLRERVADLSRGAAVDVDTVEHREHQVAGVDQCAILCPDPRVELAPRFAS